eukprot:3986315-Prymnesium_polylepis.1
MGLRTTARPDFHTCGGHVGRPRGDRVALTRRSRGGRAAHLDDGHPGDCGGGAILGVRVDGV